MDNFEKIELIVGGMLKVQERKLEMCRYGEGKPDGHNPTYIIDVQSGVDMLRRVLCEMEAIKRDDASVRDEVVRKMYGSL
jgi:hypothetical protein